MTTLDQILLSSSFCLIRPAFDLRLPLAVWSCSLAVFSMVGAARTWTELVHVLARGGLHQARPLSLSPPHVLIINILTK